MDDGEHEWRVRFDVGVLRWTLENLLNLWGVGEKDPPLPLDSHTLNSLGRGLMSSVNCLIAGFWTFAARGSQHMQNRGGDGINA